MIKQNMARYGDLSYDSWKQLAMDRDKFHKKLLDIYGKQESDDSDSGNEYFYFIYHPMYSFFLSFQNPYLIRSNRNVF